MKKKWLKLLLIFVLTVICFLAAAPTAVRDKLYVKWPKPIQIHLGLDLRGGSHVAYEADLSKFETSQKERAMESLRNVIDKRVNALGLSEPNIYVTRFGDSRRLVVELPGVEVNKAKDLIGKTAKLEFKTLDESNLEAPWKATGLEGKHLKKASITYDQQTNAPQVSIEFNSEGAKMFGELTKENIGKNIGIFLDDEVISAPTVQTEISDGNAVITGKFDIEEASNLKIQLNAGALPVEIKLVEERTVGATLGQESVKKSLFAGVIAILIVFLFMIIYYRLPGFVASLALVIYTMLLLAIFKGAFYIFPPVTLTLAGITAFILSIGMAVDANILIFERMKEEFRDGKGYAAALDAGFRRAWPSIRDSNIATFITCGILIAFGSTIIKGFAYTLLIGVAASMFTAIIITRTILLSFVGTSLSKKPKLFGFIREDGELK